MKILPRYTKIFLWGLMVLFLFPQCSSDHSPKVSVRILSPRNGEMITGNFDLIYSAIPEECTI
jgi:hypothetical protein